MATDSASALPLNSGSQMAKSTAINFLVARNIFAEWQVLSILSNGASR
jgi:hypothetical protein